MTKKFINQIIFDPDNMALTYIAIFFLFSVLCLETLIHKTSPTFYWNLFFSIEFTLLWYVIALKYQIDKCVGFKKWFIDLKIRVTSVYSKTTVYKTSGSDKIFLIILGVLLIFCVKSFVDFNNLNFNSFTLLASGKLSPGEEKFWDLIKSEAAPMTGFYLTLSILILTIIKEIISDAKNRYNNEKLNEKYETILKKLDKIQEHQKRE